MKQDLILVTIDTDYCDYLRKYDSRVSYNSGNKEARPFVGALITIEDMMYFAPLASPKPKHLNPKMEKIVDFIRIDNGVLGGINLNNMIPVTEKNVNRVDLKIKSTDSTEEIQYKSLLLKQLEWLITHDEKISDKTKTLYDFHLSGKMWPALKERCCDWKLLEEKCKEYNQN